MYDRPINPPEPKLTDLTVNVEGFALDHGETLEKITRATGGEAHWVGQEEGPGGYREFHASTVVEDVEDYDTAEDIVHNLLIDHAEDIVDLDNLFIRAERIEDDEPDWDAIYKDRRAEEYFV